MFTVLFIIFMWRARHEISKDPEDWIVACTFLGIAILCDLALVALLKFDLERWQLQR